MLLSLSFCYRGALVVPMPLIFPLVTFLAGTPKLETIGAMDGRQHWSCDSTLLCGAQRSWRPASEEECQQGLAIGDSGSAH